MSKETENTLKPCPFCGGEPKSGFGKVCCTSTYCIINSSDGVERWVDVKKWNTRSTPKIDKALEEIRFIGTGIELRRKILSKYMNDLYNYKQVTTVPTSQVFNWFGDIHRDVDKILSLLEGK